MSVAGQTLGSQHRRPPSGRWPDIGTTRRDLEIDTLTVSHYETGNILPSLTVVEVVARLLNTTIADLLGEVSIQPV